MKKEMLRFERVCAKNSRYGCIRDVDLLARQGECINIAGYENSGRRLLARIFKGEGEIEMGHIYANGKELQQCSRQEFEQNKIFYIGAAVPFVNSLDLAENFFLLRRSRLRKFRMDKRAMRLQTQSCFDALSLEYNASALMETLCSGDKLQVAIARAVDQKAKLLVLDNISLGLIKGEIDAVVSLLSRVKALNISVVVADNWSDCFDKITDHLIVMKNDRIEKKIFDHEKFGLREVLMRPGNTEVPQHTALNRTTYSDENGIRVDLLCNDNAVSFVAKRGQILLLHIKAAAQLAAYCEQLMGKLPGGSVRLGNDVVSLKNVKECARHRIALWDGRREATMLLPNMTATENILLPSLQRMSSGGLFFEKAAQHIVQDEDFWGGALHDIDNKTVTPDVNISIMLSRFKLFNPKVLFLYNVFSTADSFNRGVLCSALRELCGRGTAVILLDIAADYCVAAADYSIEL